MRRPWLLPLVPLYVAAAALRRIGQTPNRLRSPVVSIGNLSTGGTGKTPFVIALAQMLQREGLRVDVLSRGYGRTSGRDQLNNGAAQVQPDGSAEEFGDEPLLIARQTPVMVYVAARRWDAGRLAEAQGDEPVIHLLDDGFQHRQLARTVDIVLVNSEDLKDWQLPAGNLRESIGGLTRATILAVPADDPVAASLLQQRGFSQPIWKFRREMTVPRIERPVVAFCGIARPGQFFAGLAEHGLILAERKAFPDHHRFRHRDVQHLAQLLTTTGAKAFLTTEKDRVRLGPLASELQSVAPLFTAGLQVVFEDETAIAAQLKSFLDRI